MSRFSPFLLIAAIFLLAAGCAVRSSPVIDPASITDSRKYTQDDWECSHLADRGSQKLESTASSAALTGAVGAGVGALTGVITGEGAGEGALLGTLFGAVGGGAAGYANAQQMHDKIYKNCMRNRGYKVLN